MRHSQEQSEGHRAALVAGFLGWAFVAFDFFLVVVTLTAIAKEFHRPDKAIALSIALTLGFRPVGALIFGLLADRYGRRPPLMFVLVFYSVIEVLSGLAPNYATFLVLRSLFGIGMGAQWGVGASLAMEKVPPRSRGVLSGLLQEGYAVGCHSSSSADFLHYWLSSCGFASRSPRFGKALVTRVGVNWGAQLLRIGDFLCSC